MFLVCFLDRFHRVAQPPLNMKTTEFDRTILEAWAAYEVFQDLGFNSDDIQFVHTAGDSHVMVVLFQRTPHEFNYSAGTTKLSTAQFDAQWAQFTEGLANGELDEADLGRAYSDSFAAKNAIDLLAALERAGIKYTLNLREPVVLA